MLGERAFDEWGGRIGESVYLNAPSGRQQLQVIDVVKTSHHSGYVAFVDQTFLQEDLGWTQPLDILFTLKTKVPVSLYEISYGKTLGSGFQR